KRFGVLLGRAEPLVNPRVANVPWSSLNHVVEDAGDVDASLEDVRVLGQEREDHVASVAHPVHADAARVDEPQRLEVLDSFDYVLGVANTHIEIVGRSKVAAVARASAVIHIEDHVAEACKALMPA